MKATLRVSSVVVLQLIAFCSPANALTFPFTESFTTDAANWQGERAGDVVIHHLTGGADGGGYISIDPDLRRPAIDFAGTNGTTVFRANSTGSLGSGGAFIGNWLDAGVSRMQAYVKHDFPTSIEMFVRAVDHPLNSPAVAFFASAVVPPVTNMENGPWQLVNFEISPDNDTPAPGTYFSILDNVGNVQIGARIFGTTSTQLVNFSIDEVSIVPEPSMVIMILGTVLGTLPSRRRRISS